MKTRIVAFSILGFVLSACHTAQFTLHVPPKQERPFRVLKHVSVESKGGWLFSLLLVKQTEVHDLLKKQVESVQGDKAVNIRITDKEDAVDVLVPALISNAVYYRVYGISKDATLSTGIANLATIYSTRTYIIEADVIKYEDQGESE